mgnify:CR=1 FL=1
MALEELLEQQRLDGSWPQGTAQALCLLAQHGYSHHSARVRRALDHLFQQQQPDGSFGEDTEIVIKAMQKMGLSQHHPVLEAALKCRS